MSNRKQPPRQFDYRTTDGRHYAKRWGRPLQRRALAHWKRTGKLLMHPSTDNILPQPIARKSNAAIARKPANKVVAHLRAALAAVETGQTTKAIGHAALAVGLLASNLAESEADTRDAIKREILAAALGDIKRAGYVGGRLEVFKGKRPLARGDA